MNVVMFYGGFALAILLFLAAVVLFVYLKIPNTVGYFLQYKNKSMLRQVSRAQETLPLKKQAGMRSSLLTQQQEAQTGRQSSLSLQQHKTQTGMQSSLLLQQQIQTSMQDTALMQQPEMVTEFIDIQQGGTVLLDAANSEYETTLAQYMQMAQQGTDVLSQEDKVIQGITEVLDATEVLPEI